MMYENFKNEFITNVYSDKEIHLNPNQLNKVLTSLDKTSKRYDIYAKTNVSYSPEAVPKSVYDYLDIKRAEGCVPATIYIYRLMLEIFFHSVKKAPQYITADDIRTFLMDYKEINPVSNRTLDKYRGYICGYFTYLHDYGFISKNITKQISPIKYEVKHKDVLTDYECELLREACETKRELAMIEFLIATACRIGELVKVKISDINWNQNSVLFYGKGRKQRIGFFNARCKIALERYIEDRKYLSYNPRRKQSFVPVESEYLFIYDVAPYNKLTTNGASKIIRNIVSRVESISGNKHITPHRFRATTATNCYVKGMNIIDIQQMLGHSNVQTTTIYLNESVERLKNEYNRYM